MQLSRMAHSTLRPLVFGSDIEGFRTRCGGPLTGTYHCPVIGGTRAVFDPVTAELVDGDGVQVEAPHLVDELTGVWAALLAGLATQGGVPPHGADSVPDSTTGATPSQPSGIEGVIVRAAQGACHFRIIDVRHSSLPLWRQINLLADLFCVHEKTFPHVRHLPHEPTSALGSEGQYRRWLKTWKRPGVVGVLLKRAEYQPGAPGSEADACLVRP